MSPAPPVEKVARKKAEVDAELRAARKAEHSRQLLQQAITTRQVAEQNLLARLRDAHRDGVPYGVMAEMLGLTRQGFRNLQDRHGLRDLARKAAR